MKSYLLREIPDTLWITAKQKAAGESKSLRQVILDALTKYTEGPKHGK